MVHEAGGVQPPLLQRNISLWGWKFQRRHVFAILSRCDTIMSRRDRMPSTGAAYSTCPQLAMTAAVKE
jgi:hypothetical protein